MATGTIAVASFRQVSLSGVRLVDEMPYKTCKDFETALHPGDKLVFKVGKSNAGTFAVSDLPNNDAVLMLVIYRHDTLSTAVSFESHVYAALLNAQVAVVDTYKGPAKASLKIRDHGGKGPEREEGLRFNSVVAVTKGLYDTLLVGDDGHEVAARELVALDRESYIVLRTGVQAQEGTSYPMELVVFPESDPSKLSAAVFGLLCFFLQY